MNIILVYGIILTFITDVNSQNKIQFRNDVPVIIGNGQVALGKLYDASTDKVLTPMTLWSKERLEKMTTANRNESNPSESFKTEYHANTDLLDRLNHFDLDASLKVSFMGGLVDVSGSGAYLMDNKRFENDIRVTLSYKTARKTHILQDFNEDIDYPEVCSNVPEATHVITSGKIQGNCQRQFDNKLLFSQLLMD